MLELTSGKIVTAQRVVIYGPEGIGKTTLASHFPGAVFIDTEGSTKHIDVLRTPPPSSWAHLLTMVDALTDNPQVQTIVIDTADWAEKLCHAHICTTHNVSGIEDIGYGKGYVYAKEAFAKLLDGLTAATHKGINVVVTAHAALRKFEQPDEMGAYDRWELKLDKRSASLLKEWADAVLFCNYRTIVVKQKSGKDKAQGGERVIYTSHAPAWDAKNRWGLPDVLPMAYESFAEHIYQAAQTPTKQKVSPPPLPDTNTTKPTVAAVQEPSGAPDMDFDELAGLPEDVAQQLLDLMQSTGVTAEQIQQHLADQKWFPDKLPLGQYPADMYREYLIPRFGEIFKK